MWERPLNYFTRESLNIKDIKKKDDHSASSDHSLNNSLNFNFGGTTIIGRESNDKKRKILEAINILKHDECVNFKTDSIHLSKTYANIFKPVNTSRY